MGRGKQWAPSEDELLCRAWIAVSEDPLNGTGQKAGKFWKRIWEYFTAERAEGDPERNAAALSSRWITIRSDVSKFCGMFGKVAADEHSGWSPEMYIEEAMRLWKLKDSKGSDFAFKSCWLYLKDKRKWMIETGTVEKRQEIGCEVKTDPLPGTPARPIGQRASRTPVPKRDLQNAQHEEFMRIAKRKAKAMEERNEFNLFALHPDSEESKEYFAMKRRAVLQALKDAESRSSKPSNDEPVCVEAQDGAVSFEDIDSC